MTDAGSFVLNIAHRGARAFAPENTIPAIRMARRLGANAVELDVQMSRDGELIVFHDDDLTRCSNAIAKYPFHTDYRACAFSWEELSILDVGLWYVNELATGPLHRQPYLRDLTGEEVERCITSADADEYESGSVRIPRLRDALVVAHECQLVVVIELKTIPRPYPSMSTKTIDVVRELGMQEEVLITSFDHVLLADVRRQDAAIPTGVLTGERLYRPHDYLHALDADAFEPSADVIQHDMSARDVNTEIVHELTRAGFLVNVWTENSESRMVTLLEAGVTGIFSDYPNRLTHALEQLGWTLPERPHMRRRT